MNDEVDNEVNYDVRVKVSKDVDELMQNDASFEDIIDYYDNAIKKMPDNTEVLYQKSAFLWDQGKWNDSIMVLNKLLEIEPNHEGALILKNDCLSQIENDE